MTTKTTKKETATKKAPLKPTRELTPEQIVSRHYGKANSKIHKLQIASSTNKMVVAEAFHAIAAGCGLDRESSRQYIHTFTTLIDKKSSEGFLNLIKADGQSLKVLNSYAEKKFEWLYNEDIGPTSFTREQKFNELLKSEWAIAVHEQLAKINPDKVKTLTQIQKAFAKRF